MSNLILGNQQHEPAPVITPAPATSSQTALAHAEALASTRVPSKAGEVHAVEKSPDELLREGYSGPNRGQYMLGSDVDAKLDASAVSAVSAADALQEMKPGTQRERHEDPSAVIAAAKQKPDVPAEDNIDWMDGSFRRKTLFDAVSMQEEPSEPFSEFYTKNHKVTQAGMNVADLIQIEQKKPTRSLFGR